MRFLALGIAMALLIIANGIALINPILKVVPPKYWNAHASPMPIKSIWKIDSNEDFETTVSLDLFSSSSNEPSRTISISPTVPKTGRTGVRFGIDMPKKTAPCFTHQPNMSNRITDGIFVFEALISKRYAKSNSKQIVIIMVVVI